MINHESSERGIYVIKILPANIRIKALQKLDVHERVKMRITLFIWACTRTTISFLLFEYKYGDILKLEKSLLLV